MSSKLKISKERLKDNPQCGQKRTYRRWIEETDLVRFDVKVKETDLQILADRDFSHIAKESILTHRGFLETYILQYPEFQKTLKPWPNTGPAPKIITDMIVAGQKAGVGPMAAVAGAIAECVATDLMNCSEKVIIENGGDVFIQSDREMTVGIFAGTSPLSGRIGIKIAKNILPIAVCTSSAKIGHSLSFGRADAACILSKSGALADAVATAACNMIKSNADIPAAIEFTQRIAGVLGVVIILEQKIGAWGEFEMVPLKEKKVEF